MTACLGMSRAKKPQTQDVCNEGFLRFLAEALAKAAEGLPAGPKS
jgi:hypothetical protein